MACRFDPSGSFSKAFSRLRERLCFGVETSDHDFFVANYDFCPAFLSLFNLSVCTFLFQFLFVCPAHNPWFLDDASTLI